MVLTTQLIFIVFLKVQNLGKIGWVNETSLSNIIEK